MKPIKSLFNLAGRIYHWPYRSEGIGVIIQEFLGDGDMVIPYQGDTYIVNKFEAREMVKKYSSYYNAKNNVRLGVLPFQWLQDKQSDKQPTLL